MSPDGLHTWFLDGLARNPNGPALAIHGREWTYTELHALAGRYADRLIADAGRPPRRVGILAAKSIEAYAGLLGALYVGAAYVPLGPEVPLARNVAVARSAGVDALVTDASGAEQAACLQEVVRDPRERTGDDGGEAGTGIRAEDGDGLAYVLFTSGSTGTPKGVPVSHANVGAFLRAAGRRYDFDERDRFSQIYELTFDLAVFDLFMAWSVGACVCSMTRLHALDPVRAARRNGLTVWHTTPSLVGAVQARNGLPAGGLDGLRHSIFCGEALPAATARAWHRAAPASTIHNIYGPTELTIACTAHTWDPERDPTDTGTVPIGVPHEGLDVLLLGEGGEIRQDVGELCVTGDQMFAGYLDPAADTGRFLEHDGRRWYRTGDRVRYERDVGLVHLGRTDQQVKIRGYRVELGEIESAVRRITGQDAAALLLGEPAAEIAVFVFGDTPVDLPALAKRLAGDLPGYMVPGHLWPLPKAPLNRHGKIDRGSLRAAAAQRLDRPAGE
ncbi:amino acid adenylation domain-containing protein [Streptomyces yanii]|uniref:Amino acid adenylation domain-containing protein n=1 Tax=Streptomyces yanii TaxID=78510 RepID=A0ABV5R3M9_9ACTN